MQQWLNCWPEWQNYPYIQNTYYNSSTTTLFLSDNVQRNDFSCSLVGEAVRAGGEVELHDGLKFGLVAAVLEGGVVMVTAEHVGLVVREAWTVEAEVIAPLVVRVGLTNPEVC